MREILEVYSGKNKSLGKIMEKNAFHKKMMAEYFKTGKCSIKHQHVRALFLTTDGKVILQKRSKWKGDNPGLWDKTVGGHLFEHESFEFSIIKETAEELSIPLVVVKKRDLKSSLKFIDLNSMATASLLEIKEDDISKRKEKNGKFWEEPAITAYYLGYYNGHIRFRLDEVCGFRISSLEEVEREMKESPELFTNDLFYILKKWKQFLNPRDEQK